MAEWHWRKKGRYEKATMGSLYQSEMLRKPIKKPRGRKMVWSGRWKGEFRINVSGAIK